MDQALSGGVPVTSVEDYLDLYRLYGELLAARQASPDAEERAALQATAAAIERDIVATKRDPAMAAQITTWWLSRYPNGGKP